MSEKNWRTIKQDTFMEVIPIADGKEHLLGDECWCNPKVEEVEDGNPPLLISHNALDNRE